MLFHCLDNIKCLFPTKSQKGIVLLRSWLVLAEKLCWYPHDEVTVRKPISLLILKQQGFP